MNLYDETSCIALGVGVNWRLSGSAMWEATSRRPRGT